MMAEGHRTAARSVIDAGKHGGTMPRTGTHQRQLLPSPERRGSFGANTIALGCGGAAAREPPPAIAPAPPMLPPPAPPASAHPLHLSQNLAVTAAALAIE